MEDLSDNEREEQLRRWWAENWLWIVGGIALGLGALAGWQYWQKSRLQAAERAEVEYLAVLDALGKADAPTAAKKADDLRSLYSGSPYADQADLALARSFVDQRKYDDAAQRLRAVADGSRDPQLRHVAATRLARVLAEQGKHDEALKLLDAQQAGAFAPVYHEIRGDVLAAKGDAAGARAAYDAALAADNTGEGPALDTRYVGLKRDALAVAAPASVAAGAAATAAPAAAPAATPGGTQP